MASSSKRTRDLGYYLLQGMFGILPVVITVFVLVVFFRFIEAQLDTVLYFIPDQYRHTLWVTIPAEVAAFLLVCTLLIVWGMIIESVIGKFIQRWISAVFEAIPGANVVYRASHQAVDVLTMEKDAILIKPVLVQWPSAGRWAIGFDTGSMGVSAAVAGDSASNEFHSVFVPTTPNPTSGFLVVLPIEEIRESGLTTEEAVKLILTAGVAKPGSQTTAPAA